MGHQIERSNSFKILSSDLKVVFTSGCHKPSQPSRCPTKSCALPSTKGYWKPQIIDLNYFQNGSGIWMTAAEVSDNLNEERDGENCRQRRGSQRERELVGFEERR